MLRPSTTLQTALAVVALVGCDREGPRGDEAPMIFTAAQERLEVPGQQEPTRAERSATVDATRRTAIVEAASPHCSSAALNSSMCGRVAASTSRSLSDAH